MISIATRVPGSNALAFVGGITVSASINVLTSFVTGGTNAEARLWIVGAAVLWLFSAVAAMWASGIKQTIEVAVGGASNALLTKRETDQIGRDLVREHGRRLLLSSGLMVFLFGVACLCAYQAAVQVSAATETP